MRAKEMRISNIEIRRRNDECLLCVHYGSYSNEQVKNKYSYIYTDSQREHYICAPIHPPGLNTFNIVVVVHLHSTTAPHNVVADLNDSSGRNTTNS